MRLIDADKLINEVEQHCIDDEITCRDDVIEIIEAAPTIENSHPGKWLEDSGVIACSHCHIIWLYRRTKYCPNCGARMKGEKND